MIAAPVFLLWLLRAQPAPPPPPYLPAAIGWPAGDCTGLPIARQYEDRWFGEDKVRHLAMAFFTTSFGHAAARTVGFEAGAATALGAAGGVAASLGKEYFDRRSGGPFSVRDLVWDAAGIALGVVLVRAAR